MKQPRDMFYSNYQAGGFEGPNVIYTPPQGYMINNQYQAYGPNVMIPNTNNNVSYGNYQDDYDNRISKLERQIRNLDARLKKLETTGSNITDDTIVDSNLYMI